MSMFEKIFSAVLRGVACFFLAVQFLNPKKAHSVRLSSPEVHLAGWNARCLDHADLNDDGLQDLVYFNLDRSCIEILYRCKKGKIPPRIRPVEKNRWEPVLEDALYIKERIFVPTNLTSLAIGDLNQDGLPDLVRGSSEDGVFVHFRESNSTWSEPLLLDTGKLRPFPKSLQIMSHPPNGNSALFLFGVDGLERLDFRDGKPSYPSMLAREDGKRAYGTELLDLNGDGFIDWIYLVPEDKDSLKLRLGDESGFGLESSFDLSLSSFPIPFSKEKEKDPIRFCSVEANSNEAVVFFFKKNLLELADKEANVLSYDLFSESNRGASWAMEDFDGDGWVDLVVADSSHGELLFLPGKSGGAFKGIIKNPSLRGISCLVPVRSNGETRTKLLILSKDEEVVGLADFTTKGTFSFPNLLPTKGLPLIACSGDWDSDEQDEILMVTKFNDGFFLETWKLDEDGEFRMLHSFELVEWRREPVGIFPFHLNGDGILDLLVLSSRDAPSVFIGSSSGEWKEVAKDSVVRKSFLKGVGTDRLGLVENANSPSDEILISGKGFVRSAIWEKDDFKVTRQFNSEDQSKELYVPQWLDMDKDGADELYAYHSGGYWERLSGGFKGGSIKIGTDKSMIRPLQSSVIHSQEWEILLSLGTSGFQILTHSDSENFGIKVESRYLTDLPGVRYNGIEWGDFNGDGLDDLVCLDGRKNLLEFLSFDASQKTLSSLMHFQIFEQNMHYQGKKGGMYEPREGLVLDLNGDLLDDLVLLIHDRLLCYHQLGGKKK